MKVSNSSGKRFLLYRTSKKRVKLFSKLHLKSGCLVVLKRHSSFCTRFEDSCCRTCEYDDLIKYFEIEQLSRKSLKFVNPDNQTPIIYFRVCTDCFSKT